MNGTQLGALPVAGLTTHEQLNTFAETVAQDVHPGKREAAYIAARAAAAAGMTLRHHFAALGFAKLIGELQLEPEFADLQAKNNDKRLRFAAQLAVRGADALLDKLAGDGRIAP